MNKEEYSVIIEQQKREIRNIRKVQKDERTKLYSILCNLLNNLEDDLQLDLKNGESGYKTHEKSHKAIKKYTLKALNKAIEKSKLSLCQLPKGEKSLSDVQGKKEDAPNNQNGDGAITKVVDSSSHLPNSSPVDIKFNFPFIRKVYRKC